MMMMNLATASTVPAPRPSLHHVARPGGRIAYERIGPPDAPALLAIPSMGDTRAQFRRLAPLLAAGGRQLLLADLRGHGDSDAGFPRYEVADLADDLLAVLDDAGLPAATLVGASIGAAAAILAAARAPARVERLVLLGPVTRDLPSDRWTRPLAPLLFARSWGAWVWSTFYDTLFKRHRPADQAAHRAFLRRHLREPGRLAALVAQMRASKAEAAAARRAVRAPALVLMGSRDPDFSDATAEAHRLAAELGGGADVRIFDGVGHYPHLEAPEEVARLIVAP